MCLGQCPAVPGQTTDGVPPGQCRTAPWPGSSTRQHSNTAHQHRHRCSILYIGFHNTIFYIAEYESLHLELGCMSTKPMGALVGKVSNCVSMFTDVTIGELCTVTQLTHTPQLGPGPGHSQWNWMLGLSGPRNKGEIIASAEKCQCLITLRFAASSVVCSSAHCAARSIETCSSSIA